MYQANQSKADYAPRTKFTGHNKTVATGLTSYYNNAVGHENHVAQGLTDYVNGPTTFDPAYEADKVNFGNQRTHDLAGITNGEIAAGRDYGFNIGHDANGYATNGGIDTANPFSKMSLLQRAYEQNVQGATNSYAAQGQQYSGSLVNAQKENLFNAQKGSSDLSNEFQDLLNGFTGDRVQADNNYNTGISASAFSKLQRLLQGGA